MSPAEVVPFGAWRSDITSELVVRAAAGLGDVQVDQSDGSVWWSESRPDEGGRIAVIRRDADGGTEERTPSDHSARTRVHEYGGRAWWVHDGVLFYANWADQRIWRRDRGDGTAVAVTPEPSEQHALRYADGVLTPDGAWIVCVRQCHLDHDGSLLDEARNEAGPTQAEARNEIVAIAADGSDGGEATVLVSGTDFVSTPRVSPDGTRLAWLVWDHPRMPWDGTELWVADLAFTCLPHLVDPTYLAGGPDEALVQPEWSAAGLLHVVSDRTDWWNIYRVDAPGLLTPLGPIDAEVASPPWVFGQSRYVIDADHGGVIDAGGAGVGSSRIVCAVSRDGTDSLAIIEDGEVRLIDTPHTSIGALRFEDSGTIVAIVASPAAEPAVARFDPQTGATEILRAPRDLGLADGWFSAPEAIDFATSGGRTAHALYYPPTHPDAVGPEGERPPVLVSIHGGPTAAARPQLSLGIQFWTSRGIGVVDVNYGGSTGYGRAYRRQLDGQWGVVDVDDCVAAAQHLADHGLADPDRLIIHGGSAGGFTTLAALAFRDTFAAGGSSYGVADLMALATDTHKFESRYLDGLIGPLPGSEAIYAERSPIHHLEAFDRPLIVLQGLEDEIVPPNQSEMIVDALAAKGVTVAYVAFEGEQHGFRQAQNIRRALESELWFYGHVLGFEPADDIPPVPLVTS